MKRWFVMLRVPVGELEDLSETIWELPGVLGVEELPGDGQDRFGVPDEFHVVEFGTGAAREYAQWIARDGYRSGDTARLKVYVEAEDAGSLDCWVDQLRERQTGFEVTTRGEEPVCDYTSVARERWTGQNVATRLWVGPPWAEPSGDRVAIVIDPGMAFGTGDHATTQLLLEALERFTGLGVKPGRVLDIGTGSGVLAIAAAKLFEAADICCTELDPQCVGNFEHNWKLNGLADRTVRTVFGPQAVLAQWDQPVTQFDLVMSNLFLEPLISLVPVIERRLSNDGRWLVTGLLGASQRDEFASAAQTAGFRIESCQEKTSAGHDLSGDPDTWHMIELRAMSS